MGRVSRFATAAVLLLGTASCSQSAQPSSSVEVGTTTPSVVPAPEKRVEIARFTATRDQTTKKLVFTRVTSEPNAAGLSSGITPDSLNSVPDPTGVNGNPAANNVDLVTTSCTDGYPTTQTFSCDVELVSGFARSIANPYVQITNATLNGTTVNTYDSSNSDAELPTTNDGPLQPSHGLWKYSNASVNAASHWPVVGPQGGGFNTATRTWNFSNPADENVVYTIVVWATEFWGDYAAFGFSAGDGSYGNMGYTDACSGGTSIKTGGSTSITLPFDFTLYNTNSTALKLCTFGGIAMGTGACASGFTAPAAFPTGTQNPVFYAFWDKLKFGSSATDQAPADSTKAAGQICYQTLGSAPNRMEVIEWRNMDFTGAPGAGASLDFEAYLYEGSNEIDLYYENMASAAGDTTLRAQCSLCAIGLQGKDNSGYNNGSTALTGEGVFQVGNVGVASAGEQAATFLPQP